MFNAEEYATNILSSHRVEGLGLKKPAQEWVKTIKLIRLLVAALLVISMIVMVTNGHAAYLIIFVFGVLVTYLLTDKVINGIDHHHREVIGICYQNKATGKGVSFLLGDDEYKEQLEFLEMGAVEVVESKIALAIYKKIQTKKRQPFKFECDIMSHFAKLEDGLTFEERDNFVKLIQES